jgi:hypothetical protein
MNLLNVKRAASTKRKFAKLRHGQGGFRGNRLLRCPQRRGTRDAVVRSMKSINQLVELSLCAVCALAPGALLTLGMDSSTSLRAGAAVVQDRELIHGKVTAKSDASLTVDAKVVTTNPTTSIMKEGKPITIGDVQVGDKVRVAVSKGSDGSLQAISVEVMTKESVARRLH